MLDIEPIGFEVQRDGDDGEKLRVLYSKPNDRFFQLQESLSEQSTFIEDQIMKGKTRLTNSFSLFVCFFWLKKPIINLSCRNSNFPGDWA